MVDQLTDSKLDMLERATNVWMKISRGDVADRFDKLRATYLDVTKDTKDQVDREHAILEAYRDYRGALKQAEVLALEVLKTATAKLEDARTALKTATDKVAQFAGTEPADRARLELERDEMLRNMQDEEKRYQIAKDLSDNLTISYNTSEVVMARLAQTTTREGTHLRAIDHLLLHERHGAYRAEGLVHRPVRPARIHRDAERDEGRRIEIARDAFRDRRQGAGGGAPRRLRSDHPRRCGEEARRIRRGLPGARAIDHRRDAQGGDPELGRDPRCPSKTASAGSRS